MSIVERIRYGAAELAAANNRNLAYGLAISILVHAVAIGLFLMTSTPAEAVSESATPGHIRDTIRVVLDKGKPVLPDIPAPPSTPGSGERARGERSNKPPKSVAGTKPVIVEDPTDANEQEFPTLNEITRAGTVGSDDGDENGGGVGDGDDLGVGERNGPLAVPSQRADTVLDATVIFYSDVELPTVKMSELMADIRYPEIARKNGIEGTVQIKALIGVDGRPERVEVASSVNRILDNAALDAVRGARFSAGRQNEQPVRVWIQIPIRFSLD